LNFLEIVVVVEFFLAFPPGCREETEEKTADCDDDDDDDDDALVLLGSIVVVESADAAAKNMMMLMSSPLFYQRRDDKMSSLFLSLCGPRKQYEHKINKQLYQRRRKKRRLFFSLSLWVLCARACVCVLSKRALSSEEDEMILFVSNVSFFPSFLFEEEKKRKRKSRRLEISSFIIKAPPNERVFSCERDFLFFFFCSLAREK